MVTIDIGFDGTKVTQCLQVDHAHKAIVGGGYFQITSFMSATKQKSN